MRTRNPHIDLRLMDCMYLMAEYDDNHFDLAIVDPEYGIEINHNMGRRKGDKPSSHKKVLWDSKPPSQIYFNELFRVSKNQIIWGANYFMSKIRKDSKGWILWDKLFSEDVSFSQFEMAFSSFDKVCKKFTFSPSKRKTPIHPTQKPVALYKWLLTNYAKEGDKILDTHLGSGSIAIACHDKGFDLVGSELDPDYYAAMMKRFDRHTRQQLLF